MDATPAPAPPELTVNGRRYRLPSRPSVVICWDGCDPAYIEAAAQAGAIPIVERMQQQGFDATALATVPTFTNPNNMSIVTGAPPAVHGVSGNFYLDRETGQDVMMIDGKPLRCPTILGALSQAGVAVAAITAKDKLLKALSRRMDGIALSAEKAADCTVESHGIGDVPAMVGRPTPSPYSADLSLFVLDAGIRLLERNEADLLYLSLSDYVQHMHAPGTPEANGFMRAVDERLGRLLELGAVVGVVADHGMSDMARDDDSANVLFLGDRLDAAFGADTLRVICPITDPFVRHHGALGGFVRVYGKQGAPDLTKVLNFLRTLPEVEEALTQQEVCRRFELPADREGDIAVIARPGVALGAHAGDHDLSQLAGARLRSHGGLAERDVPFIISEPVTPSYREKATAGLNSHDIFDFVLNGVASP
ncbi:MAG: phosphonoacetate hydrolase [Pseudomonadota bacterium]